MFHLTSIWETEQWDPLWDLLHFIVSFAFHLRALLKGHKLVLDYFCSGISLPSNADIQKFSLQNCPTIKISNNYEAAICRPIENITKGKPSSVATCKFFIQCQTGGIFNIRFGPAIGKRSGSKRVWVWSVQIFDWVFPGFWLPEQLYTYTWDLLSHSFMIHHSEWLTRQCACIWSDSFKLPYTSKLEVKGQWSDWAFGPPPYPWISFSARFCPKVRFISSLYVTSVTTVRNCSSWR